MLPLHPCAPLLVAMVSTDMYDFVDYLAISEEQKTRSKIVTRFVHTVVLNIYLHIRSISMIANIFCFNPSILLPSSIFAVLPCVIAYLNTRDEKIDIKKFQNTQELLSLIYSTWLSAMTVILFPGLRNKILLLGQIVIHAGVALLKSRATFQTEDSISRFSIILNHGILVVIAPLLMQHKVAALILSLNTIFYFSKFFLLKSPQHETS